ncbi:MAG: hypothetical protein M1830_000154 [Pleopsidium flavum]|nr:MAG: hypothetical protein M1830_000154 [Pleopsidium flavum]
MATPTPSSTKHLPTPSSHHSSTPHTTTAMTPNSFANHLAGSPLPSTTTTAAGTIRSAPSPASYLHPSKSSKSPFNTAAGLIPHSHPNSSTPHLPLLVGFDSPSSAAAVVNGLGGLNIAGLNGTPTAIGPTSGAVAGVSFAASSVNARDNEDERRRRIEAILGILRQRPGRVSEEGVERLAKRTGLECLWEDGMGGEGEGTRTLSVAGNNVLVDVDFQGEDVVEKVGLSFPTCKMDGVVDFAEKGARVLQEDLQVGKGDEMGYRMLDPFADNLERLARLDKLSSNGANCYEAVAGVAASLKSVSEFEKRKAREGKTVGVEEMVVEREVLCKRSGRPRMHARRRVGLSLEYWMNRRLVHGRKRKAEEMDVDMDADPKPEKVGAEEEDDDEPDIWSAVIECEASPAELYPSIRVTDNWISTEVEKPNETNESRDMSFPTGETILDWLDPPAMLIPATIQGDLMVVDTGVPAEGKPPDVRFVAKLEPPVILPLQTAVEIYGSVDVTIPQESIRPTTFEELLLPSTSLGSSITQTEDRQLVVERTITAYDKAGNAVDHKHRNTLYAPKQEFGRLIEEIPFSHPRQLVAILPVLRQWALVGSILQKSFATNDTDDVCTVPSNDAPEGKPSMRTNGRSAEEELATLMADTKAGGPERDTIVPVDFSLTTLPTPKIAIIFDLVGALASVVFEVLPNAEIHASAVTSSVTASKEENEDANDNAAMMDAEAFRKALAISADVGVVVEWVRTRNGAK